MDRGAAGVMIAPPSTLRTDDQMVGSFALGPVAWCIAHLQFKARR